MIIEPGIQSATEIDEKDQNILDNPRVLQEIIIEELSIDGICGVY